MNVLNDMQALRNALFVAIDELDAEIPMGQSEQDVMRQRIGKANAKADLANGIVNSVKALVSIYKLVGKAPKEIESAIESDAKQKKPIRQIFERGSIDNS